MSCRVCQRGKRGERGRVGREGGVVGVVVHWGTSFSRIGALLRMSCRGRSRPADRPWRRGRGARCRGGRASPTGGSALPACSFLSRSQTHHRKVTVNGPWRWRRRPPPPPPPRRTRDARCGAPSPTAAAAAAMPASACRQRPGARLGKAVVSPPHPGCGARVYGRASHPPSSPTPPNHPPTHAAGEGRRPRPKRSRHARPLTTPALQLAWVKGGGGGSIAGRGGGATGREGHREREGGKRGGGGADGHAGCAIGSRDGGSWPPRRHVAAAMTQTAAHSDANVRAVSLGARAPGRSAVDARAARGRRTRPPPHTAVAPRSGPAAVAAADMIMAACAAGAACSGRRFRPPVGGEACPRWV